VINDTLAVLDSPSWMAKAVCIFVDPEMFYSEHEHPLWRKDRVARAKAVCRVCSVRTECLAWALKVEDAHAILGGMTPQERAEIRKAA
jgi:WhiB family transcriptional regulator, redox-sensing transcriptional regulator